MEEESLESFAAGSNVAFVNLFAMLIEELQSQLGFDPANLTERIAAVADAIEGSPNPSQQFRDATTVGQLRLLLNLLEHAKKPRWTPSIVPGGGSDNPD
ncbi:hypothetical protein NKH14_22570 [Mesorhizobium sp. M1380]|uniref:hypothetical protein n=1 Tax=Mesorhizobium sp. M1380 TaxID=2957093 RepID=UPI0033391544